MVDIDTISHIVSGFVGDEAGLKFKVWYEYYRKFEPAIHSLINNGNAHLAFDQLLPTEKMVFVISACYYAKHKILADKSKNRLKCLEYLCAFLQHHKVDHEVQVIAFHSSFSFDMVAQMKLYECKVFFDHFNRLTERVSFAK